MRKIKLFAFFIVIFLGACHPKENIPEKDAVLELLPVTAQLTQLPVQSTLLPQATLDTSIQFREDCIEQFNAEFALEGALFLKKDDQLIPGDFYQFDFANQRLIAIDNDENISLMPRSVSPDGKLYFSYHEEENNLYLHISAFDGEEISRFAWQPEWGQVIHTSWLTKDRISVLVYSANYVPQYRVIVFDVTSSNLQFVETIFPAGVNSLAPMIYYHPSLEKAVYVSGASFILWDADRQSDIWQKRSINYAMLPSGWSPNGHWFGMSILDDGQRAEIYMIDPDGEEFQLTNLSDVFSQSKVYVLSMQWSPDERWIAFTYLLQSDVENTHLANLAVIDVSDSRTIDHCLKVIADETPVWSPDGQYLAVATSEDSGLSPSVVILDVELGTAQVILNDFLPIGWMQDNK